MVSYDVSFMVPVRIYVWINLPVAHRGYLGAVSGFVDVVPVWSTMCDCVWLELAKNSG